MYGNFTNLGGESAVADGAFEWPLLGMAAVVDLQRRVAGERFVTDVTRCIAAHCIQQKNCSVLIQSHLLGSMIKRRTHDYTIELIFYFHTNHFYFAFERPVREFNISWL